VRVAIYLLAILVTSGCVLYMTDERVTVHPVRDDIIVRDITADTKRFQFFVGHLVAQRLGQPPNEGAKALAEHELSQRGLCENGVRVLPGSFRDPGTRGMGFMVECN
jgi:hypothetical protein